MKIDVLTGPKGGEAATAPCHTFGFFPEDPIMSLVQSQEALRLHASVCPIFLESNLSQAERY